MKGILLLFGLGLMAISCNEKQEDPLTTGDAEPGDSSAGIQVLQQQLNPPDISPLDMVYFPEDYPLLKMAEKINTAPVFRIIYSRPHKSGRIIFGDLIKYNIPWRLGANESTELELFFPVTIQQQKISPGRYIMYCIPGESSWTLVLNSDLYSWGLKQDSTRDLFRFEVPVQKNETVYEYFTISTEKSAAGADIIFRWDDVRAVLPVRF